jgi:hypothetical protein
MKEYFRKPYMSAGITRHSDYMRATPQKAIDAQGIISPNINFKKPYDNHPNTAQMIHYYANELSYLGGDPVPPLNDPSLLPHNPVTGVVYEDSTYYGSPVVTGDDGSWIYSPPVLIKDGSMTLGLSTYIYNGFARIPNVKIPRDFPK